MSHSGEKTNKERFASIVSNFKWDEPTSKPSPLAREGGRGS